MRFLLSATASLLIPSSALAGPTGYSLHDAPWANEIFEICPALTESGLKPALFEPRLESWTYEKQDIIIEYETTVDGVHETSKKRVTKIPAFHLIEQKIGYLNPDGVWVNQTGNAVLKFSDLDLKIGEKVEPTVTYSRERLIEKPDFDREIAAAMERIENAPPCSIFRKGHYGKMAVDITYNFGSNNPYQCDAEIGLLQSTDLNQTETITRRVVTRPDSSNYYVKFPNGDVNVYREYFPIWSVTHANSGDPICPWFYMKGDAE